MKNKLLFLLLYLLCCRLLPAQQIETTMTAYAEKFAIEKIHIHFDRSVYRKGETVYYKLYLLDETNNYVQSKTVYADWYDTNGKLLKQTTAPVILSGAKGSFIIPDDYKGGAVYVHAYTQAMLNGDKLFTYTKRITVFQSNVANNVAKQENSIPADSFIVRLFAEGGFAVEGLNNHFAFCSLTTVGNLPVAIQGAVKTSKGELIDSVHTAHDGMGSFALQAKPGEQYVFEWKEDNGVMKSKPVAIEKKVGACLHVSPHNGKAAFTVERSAGSDSAFWIMHLLIHKNYSLQYKIDLNMSEKRMLASSVSTAGLPDGIVQFTLLDANWIPVAERIVFINNHNYAFHPQIKTEDNSRDSMSLLDIFTPDTLLSNMSVSVANTAVIDSDEINIFSDLLLSDELKGKVNHPSYYFSETGDAVEDSIRMAHLDLIMLTHGHRRYDWEKIAKGTLPSGSPPADTSYLNIEGSIRNGRAYHVNDKSMLNVMLAGKDKSKLLFAVPVQKDGSFRKEHVLFYDTVQVFANLNGIPVNKNDIAFVENDLLRKQKPGNADTVNGLFNFSAPAEVNAVSRQAMQYFNDQKYFDSLKRNVTLKEVVVTSRVKPKMQVLDEYYTRGLFSGEGSNYAVDVDGDIHAPGMNIWIYLQSKLPGLKVTYNSATGDYIPEWFPDPRGNVSVPALFLDEIPVEPDAINSIGIENIAYVKGFRPPFVGAFMNGLHGAIAIYSKRGYSPISSEVNNNNESGLLHGYTKFKEFSADAFNASKAGSNPGYTPVLYFNPYVLTDKYNQHAQLSFYNKGIRHGITIVLEGIDTEGKMARVVKVLE